MAKAAAAKAQPESKWDEPLSRRLWPEVPKKEQWPLGQIRPYPHNPRTHPPAQVKLLAQLLRKYGPDQPIVVDEGGVILKGHGRLLGAIDAELPWFWVKRREGLTPADKVAMRISDNQVALLSGWDNELVRMEMHVLKADGFDLQLLGFGEAQLVAFQTQPGPPAGGFQVYGENIETEHECPRCYYRWSGSTKPAEDRPAAEPDPPAKKKKKA